MYLNVFFSASTSCTTSSIVVASLPSTGSGIEFTYSTAFWYSVSVASHLNDLTSVSGFAASPLTTSWNFVAALSTYLFEKLGIALISSSGIISQKIENAFAVTIFKLAALLIRFAGLIAPIGPRRLETSDAILARTFISA